MENCLKPQKIRPTEEGKNLINFILSQMNNKRLFKEGKSSVDRIFLNSETYKLLSKPSNYEIKDGRVFIKSLNKYHQRRENIRVALKYPGGLVFNSFDSMSSCARFLDISTHTVRSRLKTKNLCYLRISSFI